jgi:hypothetical protein
MSITTYNELLTALDNWLGTAALTSRTPEFITLAEADIWGRLRIRQMEASTDLGVSSQTVALPSDFLEPRRLYLDGNPVAPIDYVPPLDFWRRYMSTDTSKPQAFTIEGDNLVFGPSPDSTYTGKILYYAQPSALSDAVNTTFTRNPDLWLYGALVQAAPYLENDERIPTWKAFYEQALMRVEKADQRAKYAGPLQVRTDVRA